MSVSSKHVVLGATTVLLVCGTLIGLEAISRKKWPQRVYEQARASSMPIFAKSAYMVFTTKPNTRVEFSGYTGEFSSRVSINSLGLRGPEVAKEKPPETYRILITGDSMVFGWGVNDHETFAAHLAALLNQKDTHRRYEVLNAGFTSGNGPASAYLYLKHYGMALQPDLVLVTIFSHNDLGDLEDGMWLGEKDKRNKGNERGPKLPEQVISAVLQVDAGYLVAREQPLRYKYPILRDSHLWQLSATWLEAHRLVKSSTTRDYSQPVCLDLSKCKEAYEKYLNLMTGLKALTDTAHVPIVALFLPGPWHVEKAAGLMRTYHQNEFASGSVSARVYDNGRRLGNFEPRKTLISHAQEAGISTIDVLPDLTAHDWREYFYGQDGHLTTTGHRKVAQVIANLLVEQKLFP